MRQRGVQHSRFRLGLLLTAKTRVANVIIFLVVIVLQEGSLLAEGGRATKNNPSHQPRRKQKFRAGVGKDFSEFLFVMGAIVACVIVPVLLMFLHSVFKDPAVPGLAREAWKAIKTRFISYLGQEATRSSPSSRTLSTNDKKTRDLSATFRDGGEDGAPWGSDESATARSMESTRRRRKGGERLDVTKYQPLLLHEYAPYLRRRLYSEEEGADDDYSNNIEKKELPATTTTTALPAAARRTSFTNTPGSSRTKSFMFLQEQERGAHKNDYDDFGRVVGDDYDALLSTMMPTAKPRGDDDDIGTYGAGRITYSVDSLGVVRRWGNEEMLAEGEEGENTPGDDHEGENGQDGVGGVYKTTQSRRKLMRNRRLRK